MLESSVPSPEDIRSSEDLLPPVTPPTGRFILQLFVIPAVIVAVIVLLWLLLAGVVLRRSGNPDDLIRGLTGTSANRWQNAQQLADMLRDERHADFKRNKSAAGQLAQIIEHELRLVEGGKKLSGEDVTLLVFVARALGEFHVDVGMPALLSAANFDKTDATLDIRRAAIQAIAVLISHIQPQLESWEEDPHEVEETLLELVDSEEPIVRSDAAFALGVLGTPPSIEALAEALHDPYPDARYNAATALARHGDVRAIDTLAEMLDPAEDVGLRYEDKKPIELYRIHKRSTVLINALRATERLAEQQPHAKFEPIVQSLEQLMAADKQALRKAYIEPALVSEAKRVLKYLQGLQLVAHQSGGGERHE